MLFLNIVLVFTFTSLISVNQGNNICLSRIKNAKGKARSVEVQENTRREYSIWVFFFFFLINFIEFSLSIENSVLRNSV